MARLLVQNDKSFLRLLNPNIAKIYTPSNNELACTTMVWCRRSVHMERFCDYAPDDTGQRFSGTHAKKLTKYRSPKQVYTRAYHTQHDLSKDIMGPGFIYSASKSCHISEENILETIVEMESIDQFCTHFETKSIVEFCDQYDALGKHYKAQANLYPNSFRTDLSMYVRNFEKFQRLQGIQAGADKMVDVSSDVAVCVRTMLTDVITHVATCKEIVHNDTTELVQGLKRLALHLQSQHQLCSEHIPSPTHLPMDHYLDSYNCRKALDAGWNSVTFCSSDNSRDEQKVTESDDEDRPPTEEELHEFSRYFISEIARFPRAHGHDYKMYSPDVLFINNWSKRPYATKGLKYYLFAVEKFKAWIFLKFSSSTVHVLGTVINEKEATIKIRWRLAGCKTGTFQRLLITVSGVMSLSEKGKRSELEDQWYDGLSLLYIDNNVQICKHVIDKVEKDGKKSKVQNKVKEKIVAALGVAAAATLDEL